MFSRIVENIRNYIDRNDLYRYMPFVSIFLGIFVIAFFIILLVNTKNNSILLSTYEEEIEQAAIEYVKENNITIPNNNELFINLSEFGYTFKNECYNQGGVNVTNKNGQIRYDVYFICNNEYSSGIKKLLRNNDSNIEYMTLKGNTITFLNEGDNYIDKGYNSNYAVTVENNVPSEEGMYIVRYILNDNGELYNNRRIIVITNEDFISIPEIILNGNDKISIDKGTNYFDMGYKAYDAIDGDITNKVSVSGTINTNILGEQTITYTTTNSTDNTTSITRKITVKAPSPNLNITTTYSPTIKTNQSVTINIAITGNGYKKMVLPNNLSVISKNYQYNVNSNGNYVFTIYKNDGTYEKKTVTINNINTSSPTATCIFKGERVTVSANDDDGISGYSYLLNNSYSSYLNTNSYFVGNTEVAYVKIKDNAGNVSSISCKNQQTTPENNNDEHVVYTDSLNYNCIKPYTCYKQKDYNDKYWATGEGGIGRVAYNGCLPTALAIITTGFNKKDTSGQLYTPSTLIKQVIYPTGDISCCSSYGRAERTMEKLGLTPGQKVTFNETNLNQFINHLKQGYPVLILASKGYYTGSGHFLVVLAINNNNEVFLSDPYQKDYTSQYQDKPVNTWIPISHLLDSNGGHASWFMTVSP